MAVQDGLTVTDLIAVIDHELRRANGEVPVPEREAVYVAVRDRVAVALARSDQ
jgi:hypothetical protein